MPDPVNSEESNLRCPSCGGVMWIYNGTKQCRNPYCNPRNQRGQAPVIKSNFEGLSK